MAKDEDNNYHDKHQTEICLVFVVNIRPRSASLHDHQLRYQETVEDEEGEERDDIDDDAVHEGAVDREELCVSKFGGGYLQTLPRLRDWWSWCRS